MPVLQTQTLLYEVVGGFEFPISNMMGGEKCCHVITLNSTLSLNYLGNLGNSLNSKLVPQILNQRIRNLPDFRATSSKC